MIEAIRNWADSTGAWLSANPEWMIGAILAYIISLVLGVLLFDRKMGK